MGILVVFAVVVVVVSAGVAVRRLALQLAWGRALDNATTALAWYGVSAAIVTAALVTAVLRTPAKRGWLDLVEAAVWLAALLGYAISWGAEAHVRNQRWAAARQRRRSRRGPRARR